MQRWTSSKYSTTMKVVHHCRELVFSSSAVGDKVIYCNFENEFQTFPQRGTKSNYPNINDISFEIMNIQKLMPNFKHYQIEILP